jgi:hypothetical protein
MPRRRAARPAHVMLITTLAAAALAAELASALAPLGPPALP